ncbi:3-hydroxyacyl-ACP dehydratase [Flavobacteriaceae bacterium F89]|uniref:3-hydroxyacyl-ACP dehydratase n=1 Tax=Cerina litoralis TaxID=2874477 RepID=A0AAE3JQE3_9FLAO|nr:3-hydroxyacyl-ACP dehydratase [Cerina litoralis]MCG2460168.1 3-hydroxyacyl-ACP dehydratase [Cerina litoralis]
MLIEDLYQVNDRVTDKDRTIAQIAIDKDHEIFKGHFPGNPVMPGVCMIQIIKELTEEVVGEKLFLSVSSNIKFMAIINPEIHPDLTLVLDISRSEDEVKVKNTTSFGETLALKLNAVFKVVEKRK